MVMSEITASNYLKTGLNTANKLKLKHRDITAPIHSTRSFLCLLTRGQYRSTGVIICNFILIFNFQAREVSRASPFYNITANLLVPNHLVFRPVPLGWWEISGY